MTAVDDSMTFHSYLRFVRRRAWVIFGLAVLVPVVALAFTLQQSARYTAATDVLVNRETLTGTAGSSPDDPADRVMATEARLARSPELVLQVVRAIGAPHASVAEFLRDSTVRPVSNTNILRFTATAGTANAAERISAIYARQFGQFRRQLDVNLLRSARRTVRARIDAIRTVAGNAELLAQLRQKEAELRAREALLTPRAVVISPPDNAEKVQPRPARNGVLAVIAGLVAGLGVALVLELLDPRIDSASRIAAATGLPLLGRVPERRRVTGPAIATLQDPGGSIAEHVRALRVALEYANRDTRARIIMITSSASGDGKATVAAELAVAMAQVGRHVTLVDLDLRRPSLARLFGRDEKGVGIADLVCGQCSLEEALVPLDVAPVARSKPTGILRSLRRRALTPPDQSVPLRLVAAGSRVDLPSSIIEARTLRSLLQKLASDSDVVLVDAPPLLGGPDAMSLSDAVDALLVVVRRTSARRSVLGELRHALSLSPARKLGLVLTDRDVAAPDETPVASEQSADVPAPTLIRQSGPLGVDGRPQSPHLHLGGDVSQ